MKVFTSGENFSKKHKKHKAVSSCSCLKSSRNCTLKKYIFKIATSKTAFSKNQNIDTTSAIKLLRR